MKFQFTTDTFVDPDEDNINYHIEIDSIIITDP